MPFLTEEIWQQITKRTSQEALIIARQPKTEKFDNECIKNFEFAKEIISSIRTIRKDKNISFKETIDLSVINNGNNSNEFDEVVKKLGNIENLSYISEKLEGAISFRVKSNEYFIPLTESIDLEDEKQKLQEELKYTEGFLKSVQKKLSNERFVNNAPEKVVEIEKKKEADALAKIETLKNSLKNIL